MSILRQILVSESTAARRNVYFDLFSGADGITPALVEDAGQPQISLDGGLWQNVGIGTLTNFGSGSYYATLTTAAVSGVGQCIRTRYKSANTIESRGDVVEVVGYDRFNATTLGLANLDVNVGSRAASGIWTSARAVLVDHLDADISSRLATSAISLSAGAVTVGTNSDKTGYGLSAAAIQAIWDALTSALTTVGSIGKLLVDKIDAAISSRLAAASITLAGGEVTVGTNNDKTGYALTAGERTSIADAHLNRDMSAVSDTNSRTPLNAHRALVNKVDRSLGKVYKEDDTTVAWSFGVTTDNTLQPIKIVDPV